MRLISTLIITLMLAACGSPDGSALAPDRPGSGRDVEDLKNKNGKGRAPDLIIESFEWKPATPFAGDKVTFSAVVKNAGNYPTPAGTILSVAFKDDSGKILAFADTYTDSLPAGASVTIVGNETWTAVEGAHELTALADDVDSIAERNEVNNSAQATLTVAAVPTTPVGEPDLVISDFTYSPEAPRPGDQVTFTATVKNQGTAATPDGVVLGIGYSDGQGQTVAFSDTHVDSLPAGASIELVTNKTWTAVEGSHPVVAFVDDVNRIAESDEDNNTFAKAVVVEAGVVAYADLVVNDLSWSPQSPNPGDIVTFSATVENQGDAATLSGTKLAVAFVDEQGNALSIADSHTASLAAGGTVLVTGTQAWTAVEGTHTIDAVVDVDNLIEESDESNNSRSKTLVVQSAPTAAGPDLVVTGVTHSPSSPKAGDTVTFTATVKNQGDTATPSGTVLGVGFSDSLGSTIAFSDTHTSSLAAGASVKLTSNKSWEALAGTQNITAWVDDVNRIPESDESNNTLSMSVVVAAGSTTPPSPSNAKPAYDFIHSIGLNTHFGFPSYRYFTEYGPVADALYEVGVKHIRDGGSGDFRNWYLGGPITGVWNELADNGIRMLMIGTVYWSETDLRNILASNRKIINAIEGQNEGDIFVSGDWVGRVRSWQQMMWNVVKGSAEYRHLPVLMPTTASPSNYKYMGDLSAYSDHRNVHPYPGGQRPLNSFDTHITEAQHVAGTKSIWATETGYHNAVRTSNGHLPASERATAKYLPRLFFDYFNRGVVRTYSYQLFDEFAPSSTNPEANFGIIRADFSRKPAFYSLKHTIAVLNDTSRNVPGGNLSYSISGAPGNLRSTLLQKSNGNFYLVLWQDASVWDVSRRVDLTNPDATVTVSFAESRNVSVYRPGTGAAAVASQQGTSINVAVPDEIVILEIRP